MAKGFNPQNEMFLKCWNWSLHLFLICSYSTRPYEFLKQSTLQALASDSRLFNIQTTNSNFQSQSQTVTFHLDPLALANLLPR
jgi:hypothetical protein